MSMLLFKPLPYQAGKKQIPVLCYHNIKTSAVGHKPDYTISTEQFRAHIKMLSDSGYHTILPDQLYNYLTIDAPLPPKAIMLSFDDTREDHFTKAAPVLEQYGFKGVFFVMTVSIGKPGYMTAGQIKQLADKGHVIGGHTWNHPDVRKLTDNKWDIQVNKPIQALERMIGNPIVYFAYPFGSWNNAAVTELKKRGIKAAFQLTNRQSDTDPLLTIRRLMVPGNWSAITLNKHIQTFK